MPYPMDGKKKPSGMMGALENMQNGLSSSVGITSSKYNSYKDGLGQAIQKAKSSMPYAQMYGGGAYSNQMGASQMGSTVFPTQQAAFTNMAGRIPTSIPTPGLPEQSSVYEAKVPPPMERTPKMPKMT